MKRPLVDSHLAVFRKRFDERRLLEAARRRAHLNYRSLRLGGAPGSGRIRFLLAQMHQNYYFGYYETVCALGGIILEQALTVRVRRELKRRGVLVLKRGGQKRWVQNAGELLEHSLAELLEFVHAEGLLGSARLLRYAHQIRWIRNMVVHERMPVFVDAGEGELEMQVVRSRKQAGSRVIIKMKKQEVAELEQKRGEITAYYCVSRLRQVLRALLSEDEDRERNGKGDGDEGSGSLFCGEEPGKGAGSVTSTGTGNRGPGAPG